MAEIAKRVKTFDLYLHGDDHILINKTLILGDLLLLMGYYENNLPKNSTSIYYYSEKLKLNTGPIVLVFTDKFIMPNPINYNIYKI